MSKFHNYYYYYSALLYILIYYIDFVATYSVDPDLNSTLSISRLSAPPHCCRSTLSIVFHDAWIEIYTTTDCSNTTQQNVDWGGDDECSLIMMTENVCTWIHAWPYSTVTASWLPTSSLHMQQWYLCAKTLLLAVSWILLFENNLSILGIWTRRRIEAQILFNRGGETTCEWIDFVSFTESRGRKLRQEVACGS